MESHGYTPVKVLGRGSQGKAYLVHGARDTDLLVIKTIDLVDLTPEERQAAQREAAVLRQLSHPNIIQYYDSFEEENTLFIVTEHADSSTLQALIEAHRQRGVSLTEEKVLHYFVQLCQALFHLHSMKIMHRDLKSANVFLTQNKSIVKLGDFGIAKVLRNSAALVATMCGTPYYYSPELCSGRPYNIKSDIWSLGCILYELMTLSHPFEAKSIHALMVKICTGDYRPPPSHYSSELRNLLSSMLHQDPQKRPSVGQILHLPSIKAHIPGLPVPTASVSSDCFAFCRNGCASPLPLHCPLSTLKRISMDCGKPSTRKDKTAVRVSSFDMLSMDEGSEEGFRHGSSAVLALPPPTGPAPST
eukprot:RCo038910